MSAALIRAALQEMVAMMNCGDEHGEGSDWHTAAVAAVAALAAPVGGALDAERVRRDFEDWLRTIWTPGYECRRGPGGDSYSDATAQAFWVAYQAALARAQQSGAAQAGMLTDAEIDVIAEREEFWYEESDGAPQFRFDLFARAILAASASPSDRNSSKFLSSSGASPAAQEDAK